MSDYEPTAEQARVLAHPPSRSARILAGPGTGKSATVVAYVERLIEQEPPPSVKLLTFTRAATAELAEKVGSVGDADDSTLHHPSTIHSFAISVLLRNPGTGGFPEPLRIADDWETRNVVRETLKRLAGFRVTQLERLEREMASNWEALAPEQESKFTVAEQRRYHGAWQQHRKIYAYTLQAELPFALRRALEAHNDLDGLHYDFIVVDEYQDLNACDLDVLKRIAARGCAVMAVGDDDQSIYGFRRAHPAGIRNFPKHYPDAADYALSTTIRCGKRIVEWANHVISGDSSRESDRKLIEPLKDSPDGEVAHLAFPGNRSEAQGIAQLAKNLSASEGLAPSDVLILLQSDHNQSYSKPIREELEKVGVEVSGSGSVSGLFAESRTRAFLALLKLIADREDSLAWATLVRLKSGLNTEAFLDYLFNRAAPRGNTLAEELFEARPASFPDAPGRTGVQAEKLLSQVLPWLEANSAPDATPDEGWAAWCRSLSPPENAAPATEFLDLMAEVEPYTDRGASLPRFLGQLQPLVQDVASARSDGVRIMTMMSSKGLTVGATIVAGLDNVVMPRPDVDQSEARRLLYVAMTRAKEYLYVTWAQRRRGPTARAGSETLTRRLPCPFLDSGPVPTQAGESFIAARWP